MDKKYKSRLELSIEEQKTDRSTSNNEKISPLEFLKKMGLIAYACFRYPFNFKDAYINFKTGQVNLVD